MAFKEFARAQSYSATSKTTVTGVLDEASREPAACPHVERPEPPTWLIGSRAKVEAAIDAHMSSGANVRLRGDRESIRKRRKDHRCLVAGVISHPLPMSDIKPSNDSHKMSEQQAAMRAAVVKRWRDDTIVWLKEQWGEKLVAVVEHHDESHPHVHFFVVGDAQRLHPGLRAEIVDGVRSNDAKQRRKAHRAALSAWLDDYHDQVGAKYGMERGDGSCRPTWRLASRQTRSKLHEFAVRIGAIENEQERAQLEAEWVKQYDQAEHVERPRMRF